MVYMEQITLDTIDLALLAQLQQDASLSNLALAELVHVSPPHLPAAGQASA